MTPYIRCAWLPDGNIEAALSRSIRMTLCSHTGDVLSATIKQDRQEWRWMVRAGRAALGTTSQKEYV